MNSGIDARGTTTSMMSSALLALATQNAFSRASIRPGPGRGRQDVDVEGAVGLAIIVGDQGDVLLEALLGRGSRARPPGRRGRSP